MRWITDDYGKSFVLFYPVYVSVFVREGVDSYERELFHTRFVGIGEVNSGALLCAKRITSFGELEADLHMSDGVGRHHQLEGMEAREEVLRHIVVPRSTLLGLGQALLLPL